VYVVRASILPKGSDTVRIMTDYQGPRRARLVVYSCCRSVCILHCISFHWELRKIGENPIMEQHENRGESRTSQMHPISGR
jgi:hypothetical protein